MAQYLQKWLLSGDWLTPEIFCHEKNSIELHSWIEYFQSTWLSPTISPMTIQELHCPGPLPPSWPSSSWPPSSMTHHDHHHCHHQHHHQTSLPENHNSSYVTQEPKTPHHWNGKALKNRIISYRVKHFMLAKVKSHNVLKYMDLPPGRTPW